MNLATYSASYLNTRLARTLTLSQVQERALAKLTIKWQCAYELSESVATLEALVKQKKAVSSKDSFGANFSPRTAVYYKAVELT